jgi:hypothetical protein
MIVGGGILALLLICGVFTAIGSAFGPGKGSVAQPSAVDGAAVAGNNATVTTATPATPATVTKTVIEAETIPFPETTVNDSTLAKGTTKVKTAGVAGEKTVTYSVTYTNGTETSRKEISSVVTRQPVSQVTAIGTKASAPKPPAPPASNCNPNYDPCVPNASDVDCAGGTGNGPVYVTGPIRVIGTDVYKLDSDHDGIACE